MNTGNALAMSPSLVTKYMDAAKNIAAARGIAAGRHPVLTLFHAPGLDGRDSQRRSAASTNPSQRLAERKR